MSTPEQILKQYFGYSNFKGQQKQIIDALLYGQDVLAVMPTGAGKSLCYQIPALCVSGLTVVISPLISLMKDQVNSLIKAGIPSAYLSSTLSQDERKTVFVLAYQGKLKLLYVSPERLLADGLINLCKNIKINYVAIDEAHCISQWGQDFRPSYSKIHEFLLSLPERVPVGAFTATATHSVRQDIIKFLELKNPLTVVSGFDRPNLTFITERPRNKFEHLITLLNERHDKSGIIYCSTRNAVDELYKSLTARGFSVGCYHAGMNADERKNQQDNFLIDKTKIMIATNAFGMGINKPNVNFVIHYQIPQSIESYYQEAGRAGRDSKPADCILLFDPKDVKICEFLIEHSNEDKDELDAQTRLTIRKRDRIKLKAMTEYAETNKCLRQFILDYFGEKSGKYCLNCSSCSAHFIIEDATIEAQKIVSCVFRLAQRGRSVGKQTITDILKGNKTDIILQNDFNSLSTFGIMRNNSVKYIYRMIDCLVKDGYIELAKSPYPVIKLCKKSEEIIREKQRFLLNTPRDNENSFYTLKYSSVYEHLRSVRALICAKTGVFPNDVASDYVLEQMCRMLPKTTDDLHKISDFYKNQIELYGNIFLKAISPYTIKSAESLQSNVSNATKISKVDPRLSIPWKKEDDNLLKKLAHSNTPVYEISKTLDRPIGMVLARMKLLCLPIIR